MMMNREFKEGDIVRDGTIVASIKKIVDGKAILAKNQEMMIERLSQVEINGAYDSGIVLDSIIPVRASIIAPGEKAPIRKTIPYIDSSINGRPIISIIKEHGFSFVSELQDWIAQHEPDFFLRTRIGI
jgi:hypothetical protein